MIFELIRRRRLQERYALLWIATAVALLILSAWRAGVGTIAHWLGVGYAPAVIFATAFLFVIVMLLHYSTVVSSLSERSARLTQQVALLEQRVRELEAHLQGRSSAD